jgi:hypothetical protein
MTYLLVVVINKLRRKVLRRNVYIFEENRLGRSKLIYYIISIEICISLEALEIIVYPYIYKQIYGKKQHYISFFFRYQLY